MDARTSKKQKRLSARQEQRMAEDLGGRTQPASGAMKNAKGDVRAMGVVRGEAKYTAKDTFSLKLTDLEKIVGEAGLERAVLQLCFVDRSNRPIGSFAISPLSHEEVVMLKAKDLLCDAPAKSFLVRRDRMLVTVLHNKKIGIKFKSEPPQYFGLENWSSYIASMEDADA
jgi:hypothetical protein